MNASAKTIQIFLPTGDPRGIRVAEITTRIVQVIEVPRSLLKDFLNMPESEQVAVYFLFGESEDGTGSKVYIGQTGDLRARLVKHNKEKDFWQRALVLISRTHSLTQTHGLFLEWYCLQEAYKAGRYGIENGNDGIKPHMPLPLQSECQEIFETGQSLLTTLGFPLFDPLAKPASINTQAETFIYKTAWANARMQYTSEGVVVLEDSWGRMPTSAYPSAQRLSAELVESGVLHVEGNKVIFVKDHLFKSPSIAAMAVIGRNANGWMEWKTLDGRTLDAVKRQ